jgi:Ni/Co efflux regulator RcnB
MTRKIFSIALALSMSAGGVALAQNQSGSSNSMGDKAPVSSHTDNSHHWESSQKTMGHGQHYMASTDNQRTDNSHRGMTAVHHSVHSRTAMNDRRNGSSMSHHEYPAGGSLANGSSKQITNDGGKTSPIMPASQ